MKTVYFIRHAKSSWSDPWKDDHDRGLNQRGLRDAPFMAKVLKGKGARPDRIISSSAVRAQKTALFFAREFEIEPDAVITEEAIYEAYPQTVLDVVTGLDDAINEVLVFGHNPSFTSIINHFTDDYLANLPTCGIGKVVANVEHWSEFAPPAAQLKELHFPKQYFT